MIITRVNISRVHHHIADNLKYVGENDNKEGYFVINCCFVTVLYIISASFNVYITILIYWRQITDQKIGKLVINQNSKFWIFRFLTILSLKLQSLFWSKNYQL